MKLEKMGVEDLSQAESSKIEGGNPSALGVMARFLAWAFAPPEPPASSLCYGPTDYSKPSCEDPN